MINKTLLITPPLLQTNTPYPATAYLKGYLERKGHKTSQFDLSIELLSAIYTEAFLSSVFELYEDSGDDNIQRIYRLRSSYISTVNSVIRFLRGDDDSIANLICSADFLPQAGRFQTIDDLELAYGSAGMVDCAKYLATLYIEDMADFIREVVAPHFELIRYGEKIALAVISFKTLQDELDKPLNIIEKKMLELLDAEIKSERPELIGFSIPFPGNLLSALRCGEFIRANYPEIQIVFGGGYPSTELRSLTDAKIFDYTDYIILDDGELPLERIVLGGEFVRTLYRENKVVKYSENNAENISHLERGCPDFSGFTMDKYVSMAAVTNPMHRLWSDGRWNKMVAAHGCYWSKCAFCDTTLDYICKFDAVDSTTLVDWMERVMAQTGQSGFHFVDEALPPKLAKDLSVEIIRRGLKVSWWGNIRFEAAYTSDVCQLLANSGCIAVSGGVEVASDRLLELMNKGVTIEQLTITLRNFYYAGIMVHTYLMYGFPTQSFQEVVDSLEIVRQLFKAELINSAFWHRYAMTRHSYSGNHPEEFGVRIKNNIIHKFANNEVEFAENRNYGIDIAGDALRKATYNYIRQSDLDKSVNKWFEHKAPETTIEDTEIIDHLIKPDSSRIFSDTARIVWVGGEPQRIEEGILFCGNSKEKDIKLPDNDSEFILRVISECVDLNRKVTLAHLKTIYAEYSVEPFSYLYHSKKWDIIRGFGLLQL